MDEAKWQNRWDNAKEYAAKYPGASIIAAVSGWLAALLVWIF